MGTYKVIQDVEADDKLVGPFSLRQFIYLAIAGLAGWLSFIAVVKGVSFFLILTAPIIIFSGFLAFPWGKDQPTELWLLAKLRFFLKPHKRVWDQSGAKDLVSITVPKKVERYLTDGLSQAEVRSRLGALANTIDSRGWAIKNINVNAVSMVPAYAASDRLVDVSTMPQDVQNVDITASDDMLDESASTVARQFDAMIEQAQTQKRQQIVQQLSQEPVTDSGSATQQLSPADANNWFMPQQSDSSQPPSAAPAFSGFPASDPIPFVPAAATPTDEEIALLASHKQAEDTSANSTGHLKTIKTPAQLEEEAEAAKAAAGRKAAEEAAAAHRAEEARQAEKAQVTSQRQVAIMNLASSDDQDVATLSRRARKEIKDSDDGEVVIPLR